MTPASSCTLTRISVSTRECVCTMIYSQSFRAMGSHEAARSLACLIILLKGPQQFYISRGLERNSESRCSALPPLLLSWARTMSRAIWLSFLLSPSAFLSSFPFSFPVPLLGYLFSPLFLSLFLRNTVELSLSAIFSFMLARRARYSSSFPRDITQTVFLFLRVKEISGYIIN